MSRLSEQFFSSLDQAWRTTARVVSTRLRGLSSAPRVSGASQTQKVAQLLVGWFTRVLCRRTLSGTILGVALFAWFASTTGASSFSHRVETVSLERTTTSSTQGAKDSPADIGQFGPRMG